MTTYFKFNGELNKCKSLIPVANKYRSLLDSQLKVSGLPRISNTVSMHDGSILTISIYKLSGDYGNTHTDIVITSPPKESSTAIDGYVCILHQTTDTTISIDDRWLIPNFYKYNIYKIDTHNSLTKALNKVINEGSVYNVIAHQSYAYSQEYFISTEGICTYYSIKDNIGGDDFAVKVYPYNKLDSTFTNPNNTLLSFFTKDSKAYQVFYNYIDKNLTITSSTLGFTSKVTSFSTLDKGPIASVKISKNLKLPYLSGTHYTDYILGTDRYVLNTKLSTFTFNTTSLSISSDTLIESLDYLSSFQKVRKVTTSNTPLPDTYVFTVSGTTPPIPVDIVVTEDVVDVVYITAPLYTPGTYTTGTALEATLDLSLTYSIKNLVNSTVTSVALPTALSHSPGKIKILVYTNTKEELYVWAEVGYNSATNIVGSLDIYSSCKGTLTIFNDVDTYDTTPDQVEMKIPGVFGYTPEDYTGYDYTMHYSITAPTILTKYVFNRGYLFISIGYKASKYFVINTYDKTTQMVDTQRVIAALFPTQG